MSDIEDALKVMGVDHGTGKEIAYQHWFRLLSLVKEKEGTDEDDFVAFARSYVNVDERYIRQYLKSCKAWGTIRVRAGKVYYVGVPEGKAARKGKPFTEYPPPPEKLSFEEWMKVTYPDVTVTDENREAYENAYEQAKRRSISGGEVKHE